MKKECLPNMEAFNFFLLICDGGVMKYPDMYPDRRGLYSVNSAEIIRVMRKDAGLTQKQLAEKLRLSKRSIENYEKGVDIPFNKLIGIIDACGVKKFTIDLVAGKIKVKGAI